MIATRLKALRETRGYTLDSLAELIGSSKQQVARWESGQLPNAESVAKLAKTLEVTSDYLLGLVDEPHGILTEEQLSSEERRLLDALRNGALHRALEMIVEMSRTAQTGS